MKEIYIHVGVPKTGTSAIQCFIDNHPDVMERYSIGYPSFDIEYESASSRRNGYLLAHYLDDSEIKEKCLEGIKNCLETHEKVILTDEGIFYRMYKSPKLVKKIHEALSPLGATLKIIIYLRRQDDFVYSFWSEQAKEKAAPKFEKYLGSFDKKRINYEHNLKQMEDVFGKENMIVKIYDRNLFKNNNILSDFMDIFGGELTEEEINGDPRVNVTLKDVCLEAKRRLNKGYDDFKGASNFSVKLLRDIQNEMAEEGKLFDRPFFEAKDRKKFMEYYEKSNAAVAREYFGKNEGEELFAPVSDKEVDPENLKPFSEDEINDVYMRMILKLHDRNEDQKLRMQTQKEKIQELNKMKKPTATYAFLKKISRKLGR
ncbi:MAG: hypothetical protein K6F00_10275 [Lachnospiraceae bacterium]|nr:hypothetical protein [Lachnospiraceae bacterium]